MSRIRKGNPLSGLIIQPGRQLTFRQDGSVVGQVKFRTATTGAENRIPATGSPHPDFSRAQCYNAVLLKSDNEIAEITCDYLGITRDPTTPVIEFVGNTGEEPIETHLDFIAKIGGTPDAPLNEAKFDEETGEFIGFPVDAPEDLGGVRGFLAPTSTVRVTFFTANDRWGLYELGEIASPPGNVPKPPGSRNWLKTNWSRRDFGNIYQITEEYTASGRRGWNRLIYST